MTDAEVDLVHRAVEGDRAAFEEMVRRTSGLVYARLYLECGDRHRAEDLLQETLLVAFRMGSRAGLLRDFPPRKYGYFHQEERTRLQDGGQDLRTRGGARVCGTNAAADSHDPHR